MKASCKDPDNNGRFLNEQQSMHKGAEVSLQAFASGVCPFKVASVLYIHVHVELCMPL